MQDGQILIMALLPRCEQGGLEVQLPKGFKGFGGLMGEAHNDFSRALIASVRSVA